MSNALTWKKEEKEEKEGKEKEEEEEEEKEKEEEEKKEEKEKEEEKEEKETFPNCFLRKGRKAPQRAVINRLGNTLSIWKCYDLVVERGCLNCEV